VVGLRFFAVFADFLKSAADGEPLLPFFLILIVTGKQNE
jgi:hypothetical protein